MYGFGIAGLILVVANVLFSYQGFRKPEFARQYEFNVGAVLVGKDYKRLLTSGFLHVGWLHLGFNMLVLFMFSDRLEYKIGLGGFLAIYFVALVGGNLFSLFIHRNHQDYTAVGASGAVSGIVFAFIGLFPGSELGLIFIPGISLPSWLFGLLYVLYTIYGIRSQSDNIGHEAHLGGGIAGLLVGVALYPYALTSNWLGIASMVIPSAIFIYLIVKKPGLLFLPSGPKKTSGKRTVEDKYHEKRLSRQEELDKLLDKIARHGIEKLSSEEKRRLEELSK